MLASLNTQRIPTNDTKDKPLKIVKNENKQLRIQ